jgi:hypothetical protein
VRELDAVVDGFLRCRSDDDGAQGEKNVQRDGSEERTFALVAIVENAEVCELHALRFGIVGAKRLSHRKSLKGLVEGGGIVKPVMTTARTGAGRSAPKSAVVQTEPGLSDPTTVTTNATNQEDIAEVALVYLKTDARREKKGCSGHRASGGSHTRSCAGTPPIAYCKYIAVSVSD